MKKNKIIIIILIGLVMIGAAIKANTKARVSQLELEVVELSKSERKAWKNIEAMNKKVSDLERDIAVQTYQAKKQALDEAEEMRNDCDDDDDDCDDDDFDDDDDDDFEYEA